MTHDQQRRQQKHGTGLVGRFDVQPTPPDPAGRSSLSAYLEQQLGLKLVPIETADVVR